MAPGAVTTPALEHNLSAEAIESIRSYNALPFNRRGLLPDQLAGALSPHPVV